MSQMQKVIFGVLAVAASLGAAELAFGHDLAGSLEALTGASQAGVNRAAKADRVAVIPAATAATRTIQLRFDALPETSVLARVPVAREASNGTRSPTPALPLQKTGKPVVACEPMVSTLTEVARLLQPGRCVT
jgi:hypothetical protein